jgi:hypothetical protein
MRRLFRAAGAASHAQAALGASARDALEDALMRAEAAQEEARSLPLQALL